VAAYKTEVDIANRALQHLRVRRIRGFTDQTLQAQEMGFAYSRVREAELKEHLWRFSTRRTILYPIDTRLTSIATSAQTTSGSTLTFASVTNVTIGMLVAGDSHIQANTVVAAFDGTTVTLSLPVTGTVASATQIYFGPSTLLWTPPSYLASTTYHVGEVVVDSAGDWWQSKVASNLGNTPAMGANWAHYTGPDTMRAWVNTIGYSSGDLVLGSDGNSYLALVSQSVSPANDPTSTFGFWLRVNGTMTPLSILYPLGAGPAFDTQSANLYRLPRGYLRQAPTDPKAAANTFLGTGRGGLHEDWVFEGDYIVSNMRGPMMMRYVADMVDVPDMDATFCEMLSARLAEEVGPLIIQDAGLLSPLLANARSHYERERKDATAVNSIEIGPIDLEVDSYLTCRY
jgi:hypothetical protein